MTMYSYNKAIEDAILFCSRLELLEMDTAKRRHSETMFGWVSYDICGRLKEHLGQRGLVRLL